MKNILFTILSSFILIILSAFCITATVYSKTASPAEQEAALYYQELEQDYLQSVRSLLTAEGYPNSGVTLNRITEASGQRSYYVTVHHAKLNALPEAEQSELLAKWEVYSFPDGKSPVTFQLLK